MAEQLCSNPRSTILLKAEFGTNPRFPAEKAAREASWRRVFDPYAPLLFDLYHYLVQNLHFGLVPENQF